MSCLGDRVGESVRVYVASAVTHKHSLIVRPSGSYTLSVSSPEIILETLGVDVVL